MSVLLERTWEPGGAWLSRTLLKRHTVLPGFDLALGFALLYVSLLVLIPLSLLLVGAALYAFFWAVDSGQFDDLDTPGFRALDDDTPPRAKNDDA